MTVLIPITLGSVVNIAVLILFMLFALIGTLLICYLIFPSILELPS